MSAKEHAKHGRKKAPVVGNETSPRKKLGMRTGGPTSNNVQQLERTDAVIKKRLTPLRNVLKLPQSRRWVACEFFYSHIDAALLLGAHNNEFETCVADTVPGLASRCLNLAEWRHIRRLIGRPRRCSQAFFFGERETLYRKRHRLRQLWSGDPAGLDGADDLPVSIPRGIQPGSVVLARLATPGSSSPGIYQVTVQETQTNKFLIEFQSPIGVQLVPDVNVRLADQCIDVHSPEDIIDLQQKVQGSEEAKAKFHDKGSAYVSSIHNPGGSHTNRTVASNILSTLRFSGGDVAGMAMKDPEADLLDSDKLGQFETKFLIRIVKLNKFLKQKRVMIDRLKEMNSTAERVSVFSDPGGLQYFPLELQQAYATVLLRMESVDRSLETLLGAIEYQSNSDLLPGLTDCNSVSRPDTLRHLSYLHAERILAQQGPLLRPASASHPPDSLSAQLLSLLLQLRTASLNDCPAYAMKAINDTLSATASTLNPAARRAFEDCVQVPVAYMRDSLLAAAQKNTARL